MQIHEHDMGPGRQIWGKPQWESVQVSLKGSPTKIKLQ